MKEPKLSSGSVPILARKANDQRLLRLLAHGHYPIADTTEPISYAYGRLFIFDGYWVRNIEQQVRHDGCFVGPSHLTASEGSTFAARKSSTPPASLLIAICLGHFSMGSFAGDEFSFVAITVGIGLYATTMWPSIDPMAFITIATARFRNPVAVQLTVDPCTFVAVTLGRHSSTLTVSLAVAHLTYVSICLSREAPD